MNIKVEKCIKKKTIKNIPEDTVKSQKLSYKYVRLLESLPIEIDQLEKNIMDIETLKKQKWEILSKLRNNKNDDERKTIFAEYSRLHYKIKYYNNQDFKNNELNRNKEYSKIHDRSQYFKDYYNKRKAEYNNIL